MRSESMQKFVDLVAEEMFGVSHTNAQKQGVCVTCGKKVEGFKDQLSQKEYGISGVCQDCQDSVFG